jgi:hypothetical protein
MMNPKYVLAAGAIALSCALPRLSSAQQAEPAPVPPPPEDSVFFVAGGAAVMPFGGQVSVLGGEGSVIGGVVKDKPYSASSITESTQILSDGNRIVNRNEAKIYRDSQGRTRREHTLGGLGVWQTATEPLTMVTINDPVADVSYFIDPVAQTARKLPRFRLALDEGAAWTVAAPAPAAAVPPGAPAGSSGRRVIVENGVVTSDVIVAAPLDANVQEPPVPFEMPLPPRPGIGIRGGVAGVHVDRDVRMPTVGVSTFGFPGSEATTEDLGEQVLEGVLARGTRQTQTIPAGTIGNERAIEIVAEQWYSEDIEAIVLRRNSDPRFGETTYRLVNLVRSEPAPDLFTVPQGYEVQSEPAFPSAPHVELQSFGPGAEQGASADPRGGQRAERRVFLVRPEPADAVK